MKILITGVAGLLGSNYAKYLCDKGYDVIGIDNLFGGYIDFVDDRVNLYQQDITNFNMIDEIFRVQKPDCVYHFAAYAAEGLSHYIRNFNYTNNVVGSMNIINACINHNVKKLIFTSSMAVYGENETPFNEMMQPKPEDPYGIAKYTVEQDLQVASKHFGLNYSIVRPHNVVGINQNIWDRYRNVIGIWIYRVITNQPILVYGDGLQTRAFSDIEFYMKPLEQLLTEGDKEIFNLGSDQFYKLIDVAEMIKKIGSRKGYNPEILFKEQRNEVKNAYCNHDKAKNILNFVDNTNLEHTIEKLFGWAKEQPIRENKTMKYEVTKNIYTYWK
jgi:UDP-glucose 4-epimerase